ncbi:histidine triad nucleotide-binding protein [Syntrophomonas erecta]
MSHNDCIFCKIIAGDIPSRVAYQDEYLVAIHDIEPAAPVHILLLPREHIGSLDELTNDHISLMGHIQLVASSLAREFNIAEEGYRLVSNCGEKGGQSVPHIHYHLLGGRKMQWPPG